MANYAADHPVTVTLAPNPCAEADHGPGTKVLLSHSPVTCVMGVSPCIHIERGVTEANIEIGLMHEELHHVLLLLEDMTVSEAFDNVWVRMGTTRKLLNGERTLSFPSAQRKRRRAR